MDIKSFGTTDNNKIRNAEDQLGIAFPADYKEFLLCTNGGTNIDYAMSFTVNELDDQIVVDSLFGIELDENIDVVSNSQMFAFDMLPDSILVGDSIQHGFIVLICAGADKGVYYWDHSYTYEISNDEGNMYWIAESFADFLALLK